MPPNRISDEFIADLLHEGAAARTPGKQPLYADVLIAGSGPIGCTFARTILDQRPDTKLLMAEIGPQEHPVIGAHLKNSVKYQKDLDLFTHVIRAALAPSSVPPGVTYQPTLSQSAWAPPVDPNDGSLVMYGNNPRQLPGFNLTTNIIARTVGGMATHWTCCCPIPHDDERKESPLDKAEFDELLERAGKLLNVRDDQYDNSIRHNVVKDALKPLDASRGLGNLPLAVERRKDNPEFVTWTGSNTVLGDTVKNPNFELRAETRVTKLFARGGDGGDQIAGAVVRDLNTNDDVVVFAKVFVICCGSVGTPQVLWNSRIRPPALGRYLCGQSLTFCQIVLKRDIVESIPSDPRWKERVEKHQRHHKTDLLPIPFNEPEPQVYIPYTPEYPWHVQIHRDAFAHGDIAHRADARVVVDLRFFGRSEVMECNRVTFAEEVPDNDGWLAGVTDTYGMPQPTFYRQRTRDDAERDHRMMNDMTNIANMLGAYLPGSSPTMLEPGSAVHLTGTTRLGKDPATSVADAESRVHGFRNLWVGGCNVIPDSTTCNPTRTAVAYAIKAAEAVVKHLHATVV